jgi:hypothetical protein
MRYAAWFSLAGFFLLFVFLPARAAKYGDLRELRPGSHPQRRGQFHVRYNKRRYLFRLYFVDAPESDNSLPARVAEQAATGASSRKLDSLGKEAAKFTEKFLARDLPSIRSWRLRGAQREDAITRWFGGR